MFTISVRLIICSIVKRCDRRVEKHLGDSQALLIDENVAIRGPVSPKGWPAYLRLVGQSTFKANHRLKRGVEDQVGFFRRSDHLVPGVPLDRLHQ